MNANLSDQRIDLRISQQQRDLILKGCAMSGKSLTRFLLDAADVECERLGADRQREFSLVETIARWVWDEARKSDELETYESSRVGYELYEYFLELRGELIP